MKNPSLKLIHLLIGKAIAETVLVSVIAVGFYVSAFPPTFHGWGEAVTGTQSIAGWVANNASPWERVEVQLFVDNKFVGAQTASLSRPDVLGAGWANRRMARLQFSVFRADSWITRSSGICRPSKWKRQAV